MTFENNDYKNLNPMGVKYMLSENKTMYENVPKCAQKQYLNSVMIFFDVLARLGSFFMASR